MDSSLLEQLRLRGIPQWVVRLGTLKLVKRVDVWPLIARVLSKSLESPRRQRFELIIVFSHLAKVEAELSPGNELVQKRFDLQAGAPPAGTAQTIVLE